MSCAFDRKPHKRLTLRGGKMQKIHANKQPRRPHFISEWAERRGLSQADLARELPADKSVVSRWFAGASPGKEHQEKLAALFSIEPDEIFRHPDDNWLRRFFADRTEFLELLKERDAEELDRIEKMIRLTFPKKAAGT